MRTIAIVLGDNDFGNTFKPLLESLYRGIAWNDGLSREAVEAAIRAGIGFHYLAFQHGRRFGQEGHSSLEDKVHYLSKLRVLFDEEAEADICHVDHDGGAWYLELATGHVHAY